MLVLEEDGFDVDELVELFSGSLLEFGFVV